MGLLEYTDGILRHKSVAFFCFQLVTHRCTLHKELNFYPEISVSVNIDFPEKSSKSPR